MDDVIAKLEAALVSDPRATPVLVDEALQMLLTDRKVRTHGAIQVGVAVHAAESSGEQSYGVHWTGPIPPDGTPIYTLLIPDEPVGGV